MTWLSVKNYEGLYEVSDKGDVQSIERTISDKNGVTRKVSGRMLKQAVSKRGYKIVTLNKDGMQKTVNVHKLIADAFLGERPTGCEIDHKDRNKTNNDVTNLRYVTPDTNKLNVQTKSGEPYIHAWGGGYQVVIKNNQYIGCTKNLEAAKQLRDDALKKANISIAELSKPAAYSRVEIQRGMTLTFPN